MCSFPGAKQMARFPWHRHVCRLFVLFSIIISQAQLNDLFSFLFWMEMCWVGSSGIFCILPAGKQHICVSSFIADTERQVLIYCSSNNCVGICPALTRLRLENESASLKTIVTHLSEHLFTGIGKGGKLNIFQ